jgi:hypothetical protein
VEAGGRCIFAQALGWIETVASACERALAGQLLWDQAACAIYTMPDVGLPQILEAMRRQTSRAALPIEEQPDQDIRAPDSGEAVDSAVGWAQPPLSSSDPQGVRQPNVPAESAMKPTLKPPSDEAVKAYRLKWILGVPTQDQIAETLTQELRRRISQGQVSRWLKQAEAFVSAGGVLPEMAGLACNKLTPIDPARIHLGRRVDRHSERQRERRDSNDE